MEAIIQLVAFGVWSIICFASGIAAGYLVRYCMEDKLTAKPVVTGKGCTPQSNSARGGHGSKGGNARSTTPDSDRTIHYPDGNDSDEDDGIGHLRHEVDSNLGFDVVSEPPDTSVTAPPVPETVMPPPQPPPEARDLRHRYPRDGYLERGPNVPMYFTDTEGTRVHTMANCRGLANRYKPLQMKRTCGWCCGGVIVTP